MSTPSSIISVCSGVRLNNRYEHSIYFATKAAQESFFAGKVVKTFPAYSYLRKSWSLQVDATMEEARTWSYLFFKNGTGKTYYYFITQIEYKNDHAVELTLNLDVLQTYMFDYQMLDCFVERQHTPTDVYGEHTVDEGLEAGTLITADKDEIDLKDLAIMIMATYDPSTTKDEETMEKIMGMKYGQIFSGLGIFVAQLDDWNSLGAKLLLLDAAGISDGIIAMWMYPKKLIDIGTEVWTEGAFIKRINKIAPFEATFSQGTTIDGYTPKNRKVLAYPYQMLYVTNNAGGAASYRYELFEDSAFCTFKVNGSISPEGAVCIYPLDYSGKAIAYEDGLTLDNFPTCAWSQDVYKLWLAQNQNQTNLALGTAALSVAAGVGTAIATGGAGAAIGLSGAVSGAQSIASILAQKADMAVQPPQAKGAQSSSVSIEAGFHTFSVERKTITAEYAKIIDDYFTMYGYKLNRVQKPNIAARPSFTYVKTVGCHIVGNMCNEDLTAIETIFDKGITFWKNGDKIADYTQNNSV